MPNRPRIFPAIVLTVCLNAAVLAQNGGSNQQQSPGIGGITIHTNTGDKNTSQTVPVAPPPTTSGIMTTLGEANQFFSQRKIPEAATRYQAIVKADPKIIPAQVGLMRCLIMLNKIDEAQAAANSAVATLPNAAQVLVTAGDVQFRAGKIPDAERLYIKSENLNPKDPEPYLGLWRVYKTYSLYRRAYDNLKKAHEVAPDNGPVQLLYFHSLPQADQIPAVEAYSAKPGLNPQLARTLQQYLAFLKKNAAEPTHPCKLVTNVQKTDTKLNPVSRYNMPLGGVGLDVKINKQEVHLALDTGSTGILLGRAASEKLGLQKLAYQPIVGMGDAGTQGGFTAVADRIRVGDLEFQDCVVKVTDAASPVTGQDGLIGADVFSSYLIDIDTPSGKLRLSPLPPRPNESVQPATLQTMSSDQGEDSGTETAQAAKSGPGLSELPMDAYVAPSMANWTKVYRFRSLMLVPTLVDRIGPLLFLIDTGAFSNVLSTRTAQQVTQIQADPNMKISGMSGSVAKVYTADKATLQFGPYAQPNEDVTTFDLSPIARQTGVEVSGVLGFRMLRIMQLKIDYRDGLVDFNYDPKRLPKGVAIR
ncbi:MAG TPA: aspartyl protease family protein [Verrucomicrobiae bacterium]|jgi:tetratricopeptide (TPR) repeat protein|nr:aspartyl protease family protein [Verrucomicrobiae bacterium]